MFALKSRSIYSPVLTILFLYFTFSPDVYAQAKTTGYTYDALGRLTFVADPVNGNRDYDYDKVGNRTNVASGTLNDQASTPAAPSAPTAASSNYYANCVHKATWTASVSATSGLYYSVRDTRGVDRTTTATSIFIDCDYNYQNSNKPKSVKACNGFGCSVDVNIVNY